MKLAEAALNFQFKGTRTYVQGPDIYLVVANYLQQDCGLFPLEQVELVCHTMAHRQLNLTLYRDQAPERSAIVVSVFSFQHADQKFICFLSERDELIVDSVAYPEEELRPYCQINPEQQTITLSTPNDYNDYSDIEVITSMNKFMHQTLFPNVPGKWIFTRFQTERYVAKSSYGEIKVALRHNFNTKLTKSQIWFDEKPAGTLFFSRILD